MAIPEQSKAHSTKRKYFHLGDFYKDSQMKRKHFSFSDMSMSLTSFLLLKEIMGSSWDLSYLLSLQEEVIMLTGMKMSLDRACGYHFRQDFWDDQACGFSFHQDFPPPAHLHEFHFIIDYMSIYAHDYYVLNFSLLYYMIKHRGR
jgi:hypothetical protein